MQPAGRKEVRIVRGRITECLGWKYLALQRVAEQPGHLERVMRSA
jgi:hypothetical protein